MIDETMTIFRAMTPEDYDEMMALMQRAPGVSVRDADARPAIGRFLARNPDLSFVAERGGRIVGCLMAGTDGRRGYLYHLAVDAGCRRLGIGRALVDRCLDALERQGICKSHIDVYRTNTEGNAFWQAMGWTRRDDVHRFSGIRGGSENA